MKLKKVTASVMAAITALTMGATSLTACKDDECDHKYTWKVTTPATCLKEGEEEGLCGLCGYVDTRPIPVSDKHAYGEWEIVKPTATEEGKATKVCSLSASHKTEVTLPVITEEGTGYNSSNITTQPTAIAEGVRTFVLANEEGDITFTVAVAPTGIEGVSDAIEVLGTKANLIRRVNGEVYIPGGGSQSSGEYFYEFGDNYTHIEISGDKTKYWCSLDENGKIYAVKSEYKSTIESNGEDDPNPTVTNYEVISQDTSVTEDIMNGYGYRVAYAGLGPFYGIENFISGLYELANDASSRYFSESYERVNGEFVYHFGFSYVNERFNELKMTFTLTPYGAVNTVNFTSDVYGRGSWHLDDSGNPVKNEDAVPDGTEKITATTVMCDSEEGKEVPVNPYNNNLTQLKSFDLQYKDKVLDEQTAVEIKANELITVNVINVQNVGDNISNVNYDPLSVYLRKDGKEVLLDAVLPDDGVSAYASGTNIIIRSHIVGDLVLVVKSQSGSVSRILNLSVTYSIPGNNSLIPSVYEYGDVEYVWNDSATATTVYAGQKLLVRVVTSPSESSYVDTSVTAHINDADGNPLDESLYTVSGSGSEYEFIINQAGTYAVGLISVHNDRARVGITVTVENPPAISSILVGTYTCRMEYPAPSDVTVSFSANNLVTVEDKQGKETLKWEWDEKTKTLTTTHVDGAQLDYLITLNEVYKPVLTQPTGYEGANPTESAVLQRNS